MIQLPSFLLCRVLLCAHTQPSSCNKIMSRCLFGSTVWAMRRIIHDKRDESWTRTCDSSTTKSLVVSCASANKLCFEHFNPSNLSASYLCLLQEQYWESGPFPRPGCFQVTHWITTIHASGQVSLFASYAKECTATT